MYLELLQLFSLFSVKGEDCHFQVFYFLHLQIVLQLRFATNFLAYRSAVSDEDEWPSRHSKFFIEVRSLVYS